MPATPLYWIDRVAPGKLAIFARPRGGDWLDDEISAWKSAGVDVVVSLLTPTEETEFLLEKEREQARQAGIDFTSLPIVDRELPATRDELIAVAHRLAESIRLGKKVAIHCRAGIGRSTMLAAATLVALGEQPAQALEQIRAARRSPVPDTEEQRKWILDLAQPQTIKRQSA